MKMINNVNNLAMKPNFFLTNTTPPEASLDKAPRLSIRIVIWILPSDTETSAATPCEVMRKM